MPHAGQFYWRINPFLPVQVFRFLMARAGPEYGGGVGRAVFPASLTGGRTVPQWVSA